MNSRTLSNALNHRTALTTSKRRRLLFLIGYPIACVAGVFVFFVLAPITDGLFQDRWNEPCEDPAISYVVHSALTIPVSLAPSVVLFRIATKRWLIGFIPILAPALLSLPVEVLHAMHCSWWNASIIELYGLKFTGMLILISDPIWMLGTYVWGIRLLYRRANPVQPERPAGF